MSEIEKLNMIAEWQEQHKQLIEDLDNSKKRIAELEAQIEKVKHYLDYDIPLDFINEATTEIWKMLK